MIRDMSEHGGEAVSAEQARRSRLYDYMDVPGPGRQGDAVGAARGKREFEALLGEFRRSAVLVPLDPETESPLAADLGGVRWFYAFSDEGALARFAVTRGEGAREWAYQRWLGARLLDAAVPAAGVPCGVALDCADGDAGMVFPPVRRVVPDGVAVDVDGRTGGVR
ncbi:hypothetical protein [Streptomyces nogalater]|uniref:SseB protein N-terminal domain-containing protein n=1 Tax=Streptomyces nogalater TaxID=38314 RepID=A0ABW0WU53_STRNO